MKKIFSLKNAIFISVLILVFGIDITFLFNKKHFEFEKSILMENNEKFQNAINQYLLNHKEIEVNLNNSSEIMISLQKLKDENLIPDDLSINYIDNYYLITNSLLDNNRKDIDCDNIVFSALPNWVDKNAKEYEDSVVYFCPKNNFECNCNECVERTYEEEICEENTVVGDPYLECKNDDNRFFCKVIKNAKNAKDKINEGADSTVYVDKTVLNFFSNKSLNITKDDYGTSYYFRGDVKDNYVKFAEMCWRIVRVQGDGSVKLILSDKDGNCNGNSSKVNIVENNNNLFVYYGSVSRSDYHTYPQYDYGHGCWYTSWGANHLSGDDGVRYADSINGSSLRNHLESFMSRFNENHVKKMKEEETCLGVGETMYNTWRNIYANARSDNNIYSRSNLSDVKDLKCYDRVKAISSYISTITVEEAYFSGLNTNDQSNSYLSSINSKFYTISPSHIQFNIAWNGSTCSDSAIANKTCASYFVEMQNYVYTINDGKISKTYSGPKCNSIAQDINAVPTIVLKSDVSITSGTGTLNDPYIIN